MNKTSIFALTLGILAFSAMADDSTIQEPKAEETPVVPAAAEEPKAEEAAVKNEENKSTTVTETEKKKPGKSKEKGANRKEMNEITAKLNEETPPPADVENAVVPDEEKMEQDNTNATTEEPEVKPEMKEAKSGEVEVKEEKTKEQKTATE